MRTQIWKPRKVLSRDAAARFPIPPSFTHTLTAVSCVKEQGKIYSISVAKFSSVEYFDMSWWEVRSPPPAFEDDKSFLWTHPYKYARTRRCTKSSVVLFTGKPK